MAKSDKGWYEREQGVVVLRRPAPPDEAAAAAIVDGLDYGWTLLSHNVVNGAADHVVRLALRLFQQPDGAHPDVREAADRLKAGARAARTSPTDGRRSLSTPDHWAMTSCPPEEDVATKLTQIIGGPSQAVATRYEPYVTQEDSWRVDGHPTAGADFERTVPASLRVANERKGQLELASDEVESLLVAEANADDADSSGSEFVQSRLHLHEVLLAGQSGPVAEKDDVRELRIGMALKVSHQLAREFRGSHTASVAR